ncbi:glutamate-cysteine ligase family protein [Achromobacter aloeverae]|nr:glutamate-cysteine ligase family protein [Achromobacter aloeverae]
MEMVVVRRGSGASHAVQDYPASLGRLRSARGEAITLGNLAGRVVSACGALAESGLDNGYNLLESALHPVAGGRGGLDRLGTAVYAELRDVQQALAAEDAAILNAGEHPAASLDPDRYAALRVPRPIYDDIVGHRGWLHRVGIDAKAQNSPCTSVPVHEAARALNILMALAPAFIALFANSPLECGRPTGRKDNRLTMWDRMFRHARFASDLRLHHMPDRPFEDLGDYFRWMFEGDTHSHALPLMSAVDYKHDTTATLAGDPSLGQFLRAPSWPGRRADNGQPVMLTPRAAHFEYAQFSNFLDARWRYRLDSHCTVEELLAHWRQPGGIEALYERLGVNGYIEGRAPSAVFPDRQLRREAGDDIASTAPLAPSAMQLGLLRNLAQAEDLVREYGWMTLRGLRATAIDAALDEDLARQLAADTLAVAQAGLEDDADRRWLAYARHVLDTRRTGADRLLALWQDAHGDAKSRLAAIYPERVLSLAS